jgi:hypothetical protein
LRPTDYSPQFDLNDLLKRRPILRQEDLIGAAAFSADSRVVATGSDDKTARLWSTADGTPLCAPLAHQGRVRSVGFSPDGQFLLTGSEDHTVRLWSAVDGTPIGPPLMHPGRVVVVGFGPDGETVLTGSEENVKEVLVPIPTDDTGPYPRRVSRVTETADEVTHVWPTPVPLSGDVRRLALWTEVVTGLELDATDLVRELDATTWQERRQRLTALGGPPVAEAPESGQRLTRW